MVLKTTAIYLDRLDSALKKAGVSMKRSQLLETAASAFGYHNSNEFTAAASRGDLDPPAVEAIGSVNLPSGQAIIVVNDTISGRPFAIDKAFLEQIVAKERGETFGITPFGNLADVHSIALDNLTPLDARPEMRSTSPQVDGPAGYVAVHRDTLGSLIEASNSYADDLSSGLDDGTYDDRADLDAVEEAITAGRQILDAKASASQIVAERLRVPLYTATVDHKHGTNGYSAFTDAELTAELAEFCTEYWSDITGRSDVPETTDGLSNQEIVDIYFDANETEFLNRGMSLIELPSYDTLIAIARKNTGTVSGSHEAAPRDADDSTEGRNRCSICDCILTGAERKVCRSHAPGDTNTGDLPDAEYIGQVADALTDGVVADIWFDAHDYDGEEEAENTITDTQTAMTEAARILRMVAAHPSDPSVPAAASLPKAQENFPDSITWLTDIEAEPIFSLAANRPFFERAGLDYADDGSGFRPLTDRQEALIRHRVNFQSRYPRGASIFGGPCVIFNRKKFHAPTLDCTSFGPNLTSSDVLAEFERIEAALNPAMRNLGGHIIRTNNDDGSDEKLHILLPFAIAMDAASFDDYFAAVDYLINGAASDGAAKVTAHFVPQATIRGNIVEIDGEYKDFDVTFEILLLGADQCMDLTTDFQTLDDLHFAYAAPPWIQNWGGPFDVKVDQEKVDQLFKICR